MGNQPERVERRLYTGSHVYIGKLQPNTYKHMKCWTIYATIYVKAFRGVYLFIL